MEWDELEDPWPCTRGWESKVGGITVVLSEWEDEDFPDQIRYGIQFWGSCSGHFELESTTFEEALIETPAVLTAYATSLSAGATTLLEALDRI